MAARDQLLKRFLADQRKDRKRPFADLSLPRPGQGEGAKFKRSDLAPPGAMFIPGYGDVSRVKQQRKFFLSHPRVPDGPYLRRSKHPKGATRPTPGSAYRNKTQKN